MAPWAQVLAEHGVKYLQLARTVDWKNYSYLDSQTGLLKIADFDSIIVYRNLLLRYAFVLKST